MLHPDTPGYSDELKTSLAEQVMGARLLLGEEKKEIFDAQVAFEIACKVSWLTALMKVCVTSWWLVVFLANEQLLLYTGRRDE